MAPVEAALPFNFEEISMKPGRKWIARVPGMGSCQVQALQNGVVDLHAKPN